ncbi:MAG: histidine phosphatase family protein [Ectothiorhodospiraceae bacterium]|nr:histidine phosphatase family protein [Ectothiorhodospiraceae bacterium]
MPRLIVMRHAKSDWEGSYAVDFDRPLATRGRRAAARMGRWLRESDIVPQRVLCSPAERTRATIRLVCESAGLGHGIVRFVPEIYDARLEALVAVVGAASDAVQTLMLVGHNPGLEDLLRWLVPGVRTGEDGKLMPTGTIADLDLDDAWSALAPGCARLRQLVRPRDLDD